MWKPRANWHTTHTPTAGSFLGRRTEHDGRRALYNENFDLRHRIRGTARWGEVRPGLCVSFRTQATSMWHVPGVRPSYITAPWCQVRIPNHSFHLPMGSSPRRPPHRRLDGRIRERENTLRGLRRRTPLMCSPWIPHGFRVVVNIHTGRVRCVGLLGSRAGQVSYWGHQ